MKPTAICGGILTLILLYSFAQGSYAQTSKTERNLLLTLSPGERIVEEECCIPLGLYQEQLFVVTRADGNYFIYEQGRRQGPYESLNASQLETCHGQGSETCSSYESKGSDVGSMVSTNDEGQFIVKLGNKTYGPYTFLRDLWVKPDKSGFVGIATDASMNSFLVNSEGQNIPLEGEVEKIHISCDGKQYFYVLKENPNSLADIMNRDFSAMTTEEMMQFAREQEEKTRAAGPPKAWVYTSGGAKFGPYEAQSLYSQNPTYTVSGGSHWILIQNNALYIDGREVKKFEQIDLDVCRIWVSADGKRFAVAGYDKIVFSDGSEFAYPLKIVCDESQGRAVMRWITLEHETDLVLYSKEL
jgi:hypothetical protein